MIEIGCSTICFRKLDVFSALKRREEMGFGWADIGMVKGFCPHFNPLSSGTSETDAFVENIGEMDLRISTLNVGHGALNIPQERDEQKKFVRLCLELASRLECYAITMQPGIPARRDWIAEARSVAADLSELAGYAEDLGLMLTLESPHTGTLVTDVPHAIDLLGLSRSSNLFVALDTSHVLKGGMQPSEAVELLAGRVGHVHLRDARGEDILLTPGDGDVDFSSLHNSLRDVGYNRPVILELEYEGKTPDETTKEVLKAREYLQGLWHLSHA